MVNLEDFDLSKFLKKVTYQSDTNPEQKLQIPDGEFCQCVCMLLITKELKDLKR